MVTVTITETQSRLPQLVESLKPGEEIVITRDDRPVARLVGETTLRSPRKASKCKGMLGIHEDDDAHLVDFAEYVP